MTINDRLRLPVTFLAAILWMGTAYAQPKSVGVNWCYSGIALAYEHTVDGRGNFVEICLKAETGEMFNGREGRPGASASFTWNIVLKEWTSRDGERVRFYAGPGLAVGAGRDFKTQNGLMFGLKGKAGFECMFRRGVTVSASVAPVFGQHIVRLDESIGMRYYRNGLIYGLVPEIGIKYSF